MVEVETYSFFFWGGEGWESGPKMERFCFGRMKNMDTKHGGPWNIPLYKDSFYNTPRDSDKQLEARLKTWLLNVFPLCTNPSKN